MGAETSTLEHGEAVIRRQPRLTWNDATGAQSYLAEDVVLVGSAPEAQVVLNDRTVSRIHAELVVREDGLWVRDLGSLNGTFINEIRVANGRVPHGAIVRFGSSAVTVAYAMAQVVPETWTSESFGPLVGRSAPMRQLFVRLAKAAATSSSVLISGETGTGKELVARAIHEASPRREAPFIVVDCAALPENLIESELFGHVKGAFTGAAEARAGAIESAEGGTVFLDEIGELPLHVQPKLLRVLESRQLRRVGEAQHRTVDVRFVCATHRDLREMVNAGAFREDLFFRLAVLTVYVPPLRERRGDIPLLAQRLLPPGAAPLDEALLSQLQGRPWLGNVRELRNFLERAHAFGAHEALAMGGAPPYASAAASQGHFVPISFEAPYKEVREKWLEHLEREYFRELLERHQHNVSAAARAAGVDRTYIYKLLRRHPH